MRRFLVALLFLISFSAVSQVSAITDSRIQSATTPFGIGISVGSTIYDVATGKKYNCITAALSTETLTSASAKFTLIPTCAGTATYLPKFGTESTFTNSPLFVWNTDYLGIGGASDGQRLTSTITGTGTVAGLVGSASGSTGGLYSYGVKGTGSAGSGGVGCGVWGWGTNFGVFGNSTDGYGIKGTSTNSYALYSEGKSYFQSSLFIDNSPTPSPSTNSLYSLSGVLNWNGYPVMRTNITGGGIFPCYNSSTGLFERSVITYDGTTLRIGNPTYNPGQYLQIGGDVYVEGEIRVGGGYILSDAADTLVKAGYYLAVPHGSPMSPKTLVFTAPVFYFGGGVDSALMKTTVKYPFGYSQGMYVDTLVYIDYTTGSNVCDVTPDIRFGSDLSVSGTSLEGTTTAVTDENISTKRTSFSPALGYIAPGNIVWLEFRSITTRPKNFMVQIISHR